MRRSLLILALFAITLPAMADPTPPIMPKVQETPLPPPVQLNAPEQVPADVPNRPLTAEEAAQIALDHQPSVAAVFSAAAAARARTKQAKSGLGPTLVVGPSYGIELISTGARSSSTGLNFSATVHQLLLDFNHTRDVTKQARSLEYSANANVARTQSDLVFQVKQAFYTYAQNQRLVNVQQANLQNQQQHLAMAKARLNSGMGLPVDVVRAETAVSDATLNMMLAQNQAAVSRVALAQLLGVDPRTPIIADEASSEPSPDTHDLQALYVKALQARPDVSQAQDNISAAAQGLAAAKTGDKPTLVATTGWNQHWISPPPASGGLIIGAAIQWDPFDSHLTEGRVQEAQSNLQTALSQQTLVQQGVVSDVSQAYLNLKGAEQRVTTSDAEVANAQEALRLAQGRYQAGLGVFLDVLDAQTALVTAQSNSINTRSSLDTARAALAHAVYATKYPTPGPVM